MDQYRVVTPSGREFGPTDLTGLLQWAKEGRVLPATMIRKNEDAPVGADTLAELAAAFAAPPPVAIPPFATVVALPAEFRIWEFIGKAWELVKPNWLPLGTIALITTLLGAVPYAGACAMLIIGGTIQVGVSRAILGMMAGKTPTVGMMFEGFDRFGQAFLASLVMALLVGLGMVLCIVPGVILAIMWMFVYFVLAETQIEFWPAMKASAELTAGFRWQLFGLLLADALVVILGVLACCVGVLIAQPVVMTSVALAYRFLQAQKARTAA